MELIERLDAARERWNVLEHPFYKRWSCGELTRDEFALLRRRVPARSRRARGHREEDRQRGARARGDRARLALGRLRRRLWRQTEREPSAETPECVVAWTAPGNRLEALAVMYAIEAGQPACHRRSSRASPSTTASQPTSPAPPTSRSTPSATTSTLPSPAARSRTSTMPTPTGSSRLRKRRSEG